MKALTRSQEKTLVGIPMNQPCERFFLIGTWAFYIVFTAQYCRHVQDKQLKVAADDVEEDIANQLVKEAEVPGWQGLWCKEKRVFWDQPAVAVDISRPFTTYRSYISGSCDCEGNTAHNSHEICSFEMATAPYDWCNMIVLGRTWRDQCRHDYMVQATVERESDTPKEPEWGVLAKKERSNMELDFS